ncbi:uncharacterized protein TNCV_1197891 [Trichonephila clavipes]|uniref:Uncharacterized protein n=1 Tax=Trichonephila clavipes TaxID=2585209 RepID=A0A8X6S8P7_TRICX|nr:uncharacterized protein TNCV_1197891 [Trichonephila clavipes]
MPPRGNKENIQQIMEFERGEDYRPSRKRIFLSCNRGSCAAEQFHSNASLESLDQQAPNNSKNGSGQSKGESACDDQHLLCIAVNNRTACSMQLAACWSTTTGELISSSSIRPRLLQRGLRAFMQNLPHGKPRQNGLTSTEPNKLIQVVFSDESRFNL